MQTEAETQAVALIRNRRTLEALNEAAHARFARAIRLGHRKAALRHLDRIILVQTQINDSHDT